MSTEEFKLRELQDKLLDQALREVIGSETPPDLSERIMFAATGETAQHDVRLATDQTSNRNGANDMAAQHQRAVTKRNQWVGIAIAASVLIGALILYPAAIVTRERARNTQSVSQIKQDGQAAQEKSDDRINLNASAGESVVVEAEPVKEMPSEETVTEPTAVAEFDSLIDLIVETVEADQWQESGKGDGKVKPFPTNLDLIISQSQSLEGSEPAEPLRISVTPRIIIQEEEEERLGIAGESVVEQRGGRPGLTAQGGSRNGVELEQMPVSNASPVVYPDAAEWEELSRRRSRWASVETDPQIPTKGDQQELTSDPNAATPAQMGLQGSINDAYAALPKKPIAATPKKGQTLPSPYYLTDDAQFIRPGPEFKIADEAKRQGIRRQAGEELRAVDNKQSSNSEHYSFSMGFGRGEQAPAKGLNKRKGAAVADGELPEISADLDGSLRDRSSRVPAQPPQSVEEPLGWRSKNSVTEYRSVTGREKKRNLREQPRILSFESLLDKSRISGEKRKSWGSPGNKPWPAEDTDGDDVNLKVKVHPVTDLVLPVEVDDKLAVAPDSGLWARDAEKVARVREVARELREKTNRYLALAAEEVGRSSPGAYTQLNILVHDAVKTKAEIYDVRNEQLVAKSSESDQRLAKLEQRYDASVKEINRTGDVHGQLALLEAEIEQLQKLHRGRGADASGDKYARIHENPFVKAEGEKAVSTFSIDVDTASYANVRQFLTQSGQLPPPDAVRIEELVNYFDYDYTPPTDDTPFAAHVEVAGCPWKAGHRLVRVGIKGRELQTENRPQSNLVFLIDVSGSMDEPAKLPLLVDGMKMLTRKLGENDRVAIVVYASSEGLALPSTRGDNQDKILAALDNLRAGGSTAGGAGIQLAYEIAEKNFIKGGVNRVILATDGDFNVGITGEGPLTRLAEEKAKQSGVFLTALGFGRGNFNDSMMEKVSNAGNGNYYYVDNTTEARKVLVAEMAGTLVTIAKDVKIQIEFNPAEVAAYRLIGYENRMLKTEDFNNDKKDAGEIGAGHTVTAIYEVVPAGQPFEAPGVDPLKYQQAKPTSDADDSGELLTLKLRYKQPDGDVSTKLEFPITDNGQSFAKSSDDFKFASAVASFGMLLRHSKHQGHTSFSAVEEIANSGIGEDKHGYRAEFLQLVRTARQLAGE